MADQKLSEQQLATTAAATSRLYLAQTGTITGVTNANPAVVTSAAHGLTTGQSVAISGVGVATGVNMTNTITVVDANSFSVPVAAGGAYTSGGTWWASVAMQAKNAASALAAVADSTVPFAGAVTVSGTVGGLSATSNTVSFVSPGGVATGTFHFRDTAGNSRASIDLVAGSINSTSGGGFGLGNNGLAFNAAGLDLYGTTTGIAWRASPFGSFDAGLFRSSAGVLKVTDGSSGAGILKVSDGTASAPGLMFASNLVGLYESTSNGLGMTFTAGGGATLQFYLSSGFINQVASSKLQFYSNGGGYVFRDGSDIAQVTISNAGLVTAPSVAVTQPVSTSGSPTALLVTGGAHTTLAASTESICENFNNSATVQFATGTLALQRGFVVQPQTLAFVGASTVTAAFTQEITGAPIAGTNATLTEAGALRVKAGYAGAKCLVLQTAASPTANAFEVQRSDGTVGVSITPGVIGVTNIGIGLTCISGLGAGTTFKFAGTNLFSSGCDVEGQFGGTSGNASGRSFNVYDIVSAAYIFGIAPDNNLYYGSNNTTYSVRIAKPSASSISLIAKGTASRTVPLLQLQTSAGASLGNVGGCIFDDFADTATTHVDGTFDVLCTHTTVANTLAINGDKIEFDCTLKVVGHAISTDQIKVLFAGIEIFDSTALNFAVGATIRIVGQIMRASATTCRAIVSFLPAGSATILGFEQIIYTPEATLTGLTLTATNILLIKAAATGTNSASGDVTLVMNSVDVIPAGS